MQWIAIQKFPLRQVVLYLNSSMIHTPALVYLFLIDLILFHRCWYLCMWVREWESDYLFVEKKNHNPPFKLNGQSLSTNICEIELNQSRTNNHSLTLSLTYISTNICEIELNQSRTNNHSLTPSLTYIRTNICEIELNQSRTNNHSLTHIHKYQHLWNRIKSIKNK
jgi:hypothetical protein